jgi:photosystem I P700 chlorophyll a apoprotein A1
LLHLTRDGAIGFTSTLYGKRQLAINLGFLGTASIITGHLLTAYPAYPYLGLDGAAALSLFTHHAWIGGFFIVGSGAHAALFLVADYRSWSLPALERVLAHRDDCLHRNLRMCIHIGDDRYRLLVHRSSGASILGSEASVNGTTAYTGIRLTGTADLLVHQIHAFAIHVTALILIKGVLFARSSRLVIDKHVLGFRFPCDGPGRGGTCQVSAWDHVYLGLFWMYNCISVVIFGLSKRRFLPHEWFLRAELDCD